MRNSKWSVLLCVFILGVSISCDRQKEKLAYEDFLAANPKKYSQFNEEVIIRHFFNDRRNGFYLDVGCSHYILGSTTYYLEKHLGWKGIGIDALAGYRENWGKQRPKSKFICAAVTDHSGDMITFYQLGPLSSIKENWNEKFGVKEKGKPIKVPTITLNDLLEKEGIDKIDMMSMDIEGAEPEALAGFDIERYRPDLVCIEFPANSKLILEYFTKHGYELIEEYIPHDQTNWYFKPKG